MGVVGTNEESRPARILLSLRESRKAYLICLSVNIQFMKIKAIINGATGMVGEGVLLECLNHPDVEQVLVINRKPAGVSHPKLREIIHPDFFNLAAIEPQLIGYNACFFCLGVSSF